MDIVDYHIAQQPLLNDHFCGDAGMVKTFGHIYFIAVIDALGHGVEADEVARLSTDFLSNHYREELTVMMEGLHNHLLGSRGAVGTLCHLDTEQKRLFYISVGDTLVRKINNKKGRIYSFPGIIGYQMRTIRENSLDLEANDILLFHTDGVQSHFDPHDDLHLHGNAQQIAQHIVTRYGKKHDDALCIVLRCGK